MGRKRSERLWQIVREYYPIMTAAEIHRCFGYEPGRVNKIAQYLGISHNAETKKRILEEKRLSVLRMRKFLVPERDIRKRKAIRKMEELRVLAGEPQKTKYRIRVLPSKTYQARYYLCRYYGYQRDPNEQYTLLYTLGQRRCLKEKVFSKKYKFQFKEKR